MSSSFTTSAPIATSAARKNAAGTVRRASLFAMLALVSLKPCFFRRSATSSYVRSARFSSAFQVSGGPFGPFPLGFDESGAGWFPWVSGWF